MTECHAGRLINGEGGIRTLGILADTPVFETGPINHSGTSPTAPTHPFLSRAREVDNQRTNRQLESMRNAGQLDHVAAGRIVARFREQSR